MSQINHALDQSQISYFTQMGGDGGEAWKRQMLQSVGRIAHAASGFASMTLPGADHCVTPSDDFYEAEAGGTRLVDWIAQMMVGKVPSATCVGSGC